MITPAQIRGARAMLELTQVDLANASGISKASILDIETGRTKPKWPAAGLMDTVLS
jgi:DNA-binding XRE family transcriptional regulator